MTGNSKHQCAYPHTKETSKALEQRNQGGATKPKSISLFFYGAVIACVMGIAIESDQGFWLSNIFMMFVWVWSALITIPLWSVLFWKNRHTIFQKSKNPRVRALLPFPTAIMGHVITAGFIELFAATLVNYLPFSQESITLTVESVSRPQKSCSWKSKLSFQNEYSGICVENDFSLSVYPGRKVVLTGRKGLGGLYVTHYEKK